MKKRDLLKRIAKAAKAKGAEWKLDRTGANHDVYTLGSEELGFETIPVPRHTEIKEMTAEGIFKECVVILGEGWWK